MPLVDEDGIALGVEGMPGVGIEGSPGVPLPVGEGIPVGLGELGPPCPGILRFDGAGMPDEGEPPGIGRLVGGGGNTSGVGVGGRGCELGAKPMQPVSATEPIITVTALIPTRMIWRLRLFMVATSRFITLNSHALLRSCIVS